MAASSNRLPFSQAPRALCLFRLSALGDCTNMLPIVHTLQAHWPQTRLTWVIGEAAYKLVGDLPGVEFVVLDKSAGRSGRRALREALKNHEFDALLHMHPGLRANLAGRMIPADLRLGFNYERSRDLQGWFVNERIHPPAGRHVLDGFFGFLERIGIEQRVLDWSLPIAAADHAAAAELLPGDQPTLLISPCSSHSKRDWRAQRYAAVADHAAEQYGLRVALIGGPTDIERAMGAEITAAAQQPVINLIGRSTLKQLVALLDRAAMLISPDSGPSHMANITRTPVVALHAASDSRRGGPYGNLEWAVDRFDAAARQFAGKPAAEMRWGKKIEQTGVMDLIQVEDVIERVDALARHLGL